MESATYIHQLNPSNPASSDAASDSDNHIRLTKAAVQATFPNVAGVVNSSHHQLNAFVPAGMMMVWTGSIVSIPSGWALADGSTYNYADGSGTFTSRDMRGFFLLGAGGAYAVGATGGNALGTKTVSVVAAGGHTPAGTLSTTGAHTHGAATGSHVLTIAEIPAHDHDIKYLSYTGAGGVDIATWSPSGTSATNTTNIQNTGGGGGHTHPISSDGDHTHTFAGTAVADHTHTGTVNSDPPYYALAWVVKL